MLGKNYLNLGGLFFFLYLIYDFLGSSGRSLRRFPALGEPTAIESACAGCSFAKSSAGFARALTHQTITLRPQHILLVPSSLSTSCEAA